MFMIFIFVIISVGLQIKGKMIFDWYFDIYDVNIMIIFNLVNTCNTILFFSKINDMNT